MPQVYVIPKFKPNPYTNAVEVDTTSKGNFKDLSPFYLGPVVDPFYGDTCKCFENYWQYSKVYTEHFNSSTSTINDKYWIWRKNGFNNNRAVRYPMGKGSKPIGSLYKGKLIAYIPARKKIYAYHYSKLVRKTNSYAMIYEWLINQKRDIALIDFDGYDYQSYGMNLIDVINNPAKVMGHSFIIAGMLTGMIDKMIE